MRLRTTRERNGWPGYRFGEHNRLVPTKTTYIGDAVTDAEGKATIALTLPKLDEDPGLPLEAEVILRVAEGSGRPVERRITTDIAPDQPMIGIKRLFDGVLQEGSTAAFDLIGVAPGGGVEPMQVRWTLNRIRYAVPVVPALRAIGSGSRLPAASGWRVARPALAVFPRPSARRQSGGSTNL